MTVWQDLIDLTQFTKQNLVDRLEERTPLVLADPDDILTLDAAGIIAVTAVNKVFMFDALDTTTAHDGATVLVSQDSRRYKAETFPNPFSVLDRLATPPGSPSNGDAYLITSPATGDWIGEEDSVGVFTLNGWAFVQPLPGAQVLVEDESQFYFFDTDNSWKTGLGLAFSITTLDFPLGVAVEAEQNDPPGTPVNNTAFIVGGSPTGAFVSHETEVALRLSGAWVFVVPYIGAVVFDKNLILPRRFNGTSWVPLVPPSAAIAHRNSTTETDLVIAAASVFWDFGTAADDLDTALPAQTDGSEALTIVHTGDAQDNELVFQFATFRTNNSGIGNVTIPITFAALFIDSETTPRDIVWWPNEQLDNERHGRLQGNLVVPVIDTAQHTYRLILGIGGTGFTSTPTVTFTSARLNMTEYAVTT